MKLMKKYLMVFFTVMLSVINIAKADIDKDKAIAMIDNLTQKGVEEIINSSASQEEKIRIFRKLFTENLDLDFIGKYVLGRYWRTATPAQKKEFITLYKEFNVQTWSKRFDEFKGKHFVSAGVSSANNPDQIFVNTTVPMENAAPVSVKWRVYERGGEMKVIDIIIENVSLAQTARNEYTSFIAKSPDGVAGLLENLRQKVK
jgi:phospholipid transport system substrate-binding protein